MTYQSKIIIEAEPEFPDSGATATTKNANGFIIDFYDNSNEPDSVFIWGNSWGKAREDFERKFDYSVIAGHRSAVMAYDF